MSQLVITSGSQTQGDSYEPLSAFIPPPAQVRLKRASRILELVWTEYGSVRLGFAELRRRCRCSECTALARSGRHLTVPANVAIVHVNPIGEAGLQLLFSDGHDRGIFPWRYLLEVADALSPDRTSRPGSPRTD